MKTTLLMTVVLLAAVSAGWAADCAEFEVEQPRPLWRSRRQLTDDDGRNACNRRQPDGGGRISVCQFISLAQADRMALDGEYHGVGKAAKHVFGRGEFLAAFNLPETAMVSC